MSDTSSSAGVGSPTPEALDAWMRRAQISIYAHNLADDRFSRRNGIVNAGSLGGLVLLGQLAVVADLSSAPAKACIGALTVGLAVLTALALLWDFRARALQHRFAARQYGVIRRGLEALMQLGTDSPERRWREEELRRMWDATSSAAPNPPAKVRMQARAIYDERKTPSLTRIDDLVDRR